MVVAAAVDAFRNVGQGIEIEGIAVNETVEGTAEGDNSLDPLLSLDNAAGDSEARMLAVEAPSRNDVLGDCHSKARGVDGSQIHLLPRVDPFHVLVQSLGNKRPMEVEALLFAYWGGGGDTLDEACIGLLESLHRFLS